MAQSIRIGTRGSPLALAQARMVRDALAARWAGEIEIVTIRTSGDRIQDRPLSEAGGKGLFTKEIEQALADGAIDLAVHSSKDMPTLLPAGLVLDAFLPREDPRVPSATFLWKGAEWMERETYDMFGITFEGNRDLRRIYMPPDYQSFPLRKDFYLPDDAARSPGAGVRPMEQTHAPASTSATATVRRTGG